MTAEQESSITQGKTENFSEIDPLRTLQAEIVYWTLLPEVNPLANKEESRRMLDLCTENLDRLLNPQSNN